MLDEIREIRGEVNELAAAFSPASWLTEWEKNPYALDPFIDQLRQLRARPARQRAARQTRMQEDMESVKESCEPTLAARPVTRAAPAHARRRGRSRVLRHVLPWLGLVLLLPPTYLTARWIDVFNAVSGDDARLAAFTSGCPHWLQDPMTSTLVALLCSAAGDDGRAGRPGGRHRPAAGDLRRGGHVRPGARVVVGLDPAVKGTRVDPGDPRRAEAPDLSPHGAVRLGLTRGTVPWGRPWP